MGARVAELDVGCEVEAGRDLDAAFACDRDCVFLAMAKGGRERRGEGVYQLFGVMDKICTVYEGEQVAVVRE